jgi:16S rRNA (guanine(966)-N(2))-methyltransferase RsmD
VKLLSGRWRGRRLRTPAGIRPTQARVREALFSRWGDRVLRCRFLELYAGSGSVSLEALSRGASSALAVDRDPPALRCMEENRDRLGACGLRVAQATLPGSLTRATAGEAPFDLAFVDPPYKVCGLERLLAAVAGLIADGGEIVLEHSSRQRPPSVAGQLSLNGTRRYGDSALTFYG